MSLAAEVLVLCKLQLVRHGAVEVIITPKLCLMRTGKISYRRCSWEPSTGTSELTICRSSAEKSKRHL